MRMLEHVADGGLALEVVEAEAGAGRELGHVHDLHGELLPRLPVHAATHQRERTFACENQFNIWRTMDAKRVGRAIIRASKYGDNLQSFPFRSKFIRLFNANSGYVHI